MISSNIKNYHAHTDRNCTNFFFNCIVEKRKQAQMNLFQLHQHHEVGNNSAEHAREQIQRNGEEFRTGNCHRFLALLTNDLHECLGFF